MSDPYFSNVTLLMHCDSLKDEISGSTATTRGNAAVSTAAQKFGSGSLNFPSSGYPAVSIPDSTGFDFGTGVFTVELWVQFSSAGSYVGIISQYNNWSIQIYAGDLIFQAGSSTNSTGYTWTPTLGQWYALAVDRDGSNVLRIYIDGVMVSKTTSFTSNISGTSYVLTLGDLNPNYGNSLNGYIDEVRITKGTARYANDSGYTPSTTAFPITVSQTLTDGVGVYGVPAQLGYAADGLGFSLAIAATFPRTATSTFRSQDFITPTKRLLNTTTQGIGITETLKRDIGQIMLERIGVADLPGPAFKYQTFATDVIRMASAVLVGRPVSLTQGVGMHDVSLAVVGAYVLEQLGLRDTLLPAAKYGSVAQDRVRITDALRRFLGGAFADTLGMHDAPTPYFQIGRTLAETIGVHDALTPKLLLRLTVADGVKITPTQALKMVFKPVLTDAVEISAAHVSPNGTITTWVVNTRTGAVTEYGNYEFNSFAQRGHKYLGASSTGLYELNGDTDQGASIIAKLKSGWAQFAGSRYSMFKAAYLGMRADGNVFFKVEAGTGETYTYQVVVQDMQTTKVRMGKGLRARYFAFELVTTGQDFDLDTIEFVPIVAQRRV